MRTPAFTRRPCPPVDAGRWWRLAAGVVALVLGVCAVGVQAAPITVRDDRGTEHRLPAPAQRIVSMLPSLTETVAALGGTSRLVGVDRFSNHPAAVERLPRVGDMETVAIERIVSLRPDVVLASTSSRGLDRLESLGVRVVRLQSDRHADVQRSLGVVAALLGEPQAGAEAWARIRGSVETAAASLPPGWRGRTVYFEVGAGPYAAGAGSFIGETLAALGLANVVPADLGPFPKLNPEFVLRAAPQVVMGPLREVDAMAARPGWSSLPALRAGHRCRFEPDAYETLIRPGPRLGEAADLIAGCLRRLKAP